MICHHSVSSLDCIDCFRQKVKKELNIYWERYKEETLKEAWASGLKTKDVDFSKTFVEFKNLKRRLGC